MLKRLAPECGVAACIFVVAAAIAWTSLKSLQDQGATMQFYQVEYGPAVLLACHREYVNPITAAIPALDSFLRLETQGFDCRALPAQLPVDPQGLDPHQRTARYLLWSVGLLWRATGVTWRAVAILAAMLFGTTSVAAYALARLGMRRLLAVGVAAAVTGSTLNLLMARFLRDYAKAPFMLAAIFLMGCLVARASSRWHVIALAVAGGAVVGVGLGFRNDLLIVIAPFLFTLLFLVPPAAAPVTTRAAACLAFAAAFGLTASPVLADYSSGGNTGHVMVLGLTAPFDRELAVAPPLYGYGHLYLDTLGHAIVATYADRTTPRPGGVAYLSPEYDRAAMSYLFAIARRCPADLVVRSYAAITTLPRYFLRQFQYTIWSNAAVKLLYRARSAANKLLLPLSPWLVALSICLAALGSVRWAALMLVVLVFFMGATAIQFHWRHFFYYEVVLWWAIGFIAECGLQALRRPPGTPLLPDRARLTRGLIFIAAVAIAVCGILAVARIYQTQRLIRAFEEVDALPRARWVLTPRPSSPGRVLLIPADRRRPEPVRPDGFAYQYAMVTIEPACRVQPALVRALYEASTPDVDLSQDLTPRSSRAAGRRVHMFFPVYERGRDIRFAGIEVDANAASCVEAYEVTNASALPLLLTAELFDGWQTSTLYQTLDWERRSR